jgi:nucleotide-binding universal stress UspA family protein
VSDTLVLVFAVVALYLSECVAWARHGAIAFVAPLYFGRPRARTLARALGTAKGAFTILNPLPPFGRVYIVEPWPFSASTDGVVALRSFALAGEPRPVQSAVRYAWGAVERVRAEDKRVLINGQPFAETSSARHARAAAEVLEKLREAPPKKRGKLLDELLAAHLDPHTVRRSLERHVRWGSGALFGATLVFAALFVVTPRVLLTEGLARWPVLVALVFIGVFFSAAATFFAHRKLLPEARGDRWLQTLLMLPAPTMAMRGNDKLGRALLARSHPIAVALGALGGWERDDFIGRALRDLSFPREPVLPSADTEAAAIEADFRARLLRQAQALAKKEGIDVEACFLPPPVPRLAEPKSPGSWCPRCRMAYRNTDGALAACNDCGVKLVAFSAASASAPEARRAR